MDEQNIPIDINTTKLLDWLISRRHIPKDWQNSVLKIREKINNAIQDMPVHDGIVKLVSGQHINYFHCVKIVDILKETEKDSKNIFGRYGSQRMKDWLDILACYQKDNVYLSEAASMLIRNVSYEIPSIRKQVQKLEQQQAEAEKKIKECVKSQGQAQKEFAQSCEQLGIKGDKIKQELLKLLEELPQINSQIADKVKIVKPSIDLYVAFSKFLSNQDVNVLSTLRYLVDRGNTTSYEYIYGERPLKVEEDVVEVKEEVEQEGIDFGDEEEIDFGGDIDFGVEQIGSSRGSSNEESFEIVNLDLDELKSLEESGIVVERSGVAKGDEALTLLDHPKYREQLINDLYELESFLKMRLFEMSHESDLLSMSQMQEAPQILQMQTLESTTQLADSVNVAISQLANKKYVHLHNIKHSANYVDILAGNLTQKLSLVERMGQTQQVLQKRMAESGDEIRKLEPLIKKLISNTKGLQREIQEDISKKYKGRVVNIVGGVNML